MPKLHRKLLYGLASRGYAFFARDSGYIADNSGAVVVYQSVKLIYNRIKKAGNSSVLMYLRDAIDAQGSPRDGRYDSEKADSIRLGRHPFKLPPSTMRHINEFYSFTIMRNPYSRCLSAFLEKVASKRYGFSEIPGYGRSDPLAFQEFVRFLGDGGLYKDRHWWPQVDLLFWPPERFSFIGQLEHLEEHLRMVLDAVNVTVPPTLSMKLAHPAERGHKGKVTGASSKVSEYFDAPTFSLVRELYMRDFYAGGYGIDWADT